MKSKGILIDAEKRTVTEVEISSLKDMYAAMRVDLITVGVQLDVVNCIYVDDEGLLKSPEHFFFYEGAHQPFAGSGLVLGINKRGATISTNLSLAEVKKSVKFLNPTGALIMARKLEGE